MGHIKVIRNILSFNKSKSIEYSPNDQLIWNPLYIFFNPKINDLDPGTVIVIY